MRGYPEDVRAAGIFTEKMDEAQARVRSAMRFFSRELTLSTGRSTCYSASDALYPENRGDERLTFDRFVPGADALYPENRGDERKTGTNSPDHRDALYPENRGDERTDVQVQDLSVDALYPENRGDERFSSPRAA